jgi:hypothetical protein
MGNARALTVALGANANGPIITMFIVRPLAAPLLLVPVVKVQEK